MARAGEAIPELLEDLLHEPYLRLEPPKTAGREQFGKAFAERLIGWAKKRRARAEDVLCTVTLFTSLSIADAFRRFIFPRSRVHDLIVAGGGARNPLLIAQLATALPGLEIAPASAFGVPAEAKEAFAFAVLAYEAFHGRPNNLPSATGATRPAVMGKLVHGGRR
jgi:anhydro-N-acetylmuramic acid kinase